MPHRPFDGGGGAGGGAGGAAAGGAGAAGDGRDNAIIGVLKGLWKKLNGK